MKLKMPIPGLSLQALQNFARFWRTHEPYLSDTYLAGGFAIQFLLRADDAWTVGQLWRKFRHNELDLVVPTRDSVNPAIAGPATGSLIAHYHEEGSHFDPYWQVVSSAQRLRANIFTARHTGIKLVEVEIEVPGVGLIRVLVQNLFDQFVSILEDAQKPARGETVDPKQWHDVAFLIRHLQRIPEEGLLEKAWSDRHPGGTLRKALGDLEDIKSEHARRSRLVRANPHFPPLTRLIMDLPRRGCGQCANVRNYYRDTGRQAPFPVSRQAVVFARYALGR